MIKYSVLAILVLSTSPLLGAGQIWSEKDGAAQPLVALPNFSPVIDLVDKTIVNVAGTTEPKQVQQPQSRRRGQPQRRPREREESPDQPMNPEDFFEHFFGNPFQEGPQQQQPRRTLGSG